MEELKAHKDIINKIPNVLIIGYGWVGRFIGSYFKSAHYVDHDGIIKRVSDNEIAFKEGEERDQYFYDYGFVCVPTPMLENGKCDTSFVRSAVDKWKMDVRFFCIKSTVEVGTTDDLNNEYGQRVCFSPEYLGETIGHPLVNAVKDTFIILGGPHQVTQEFCLLWSLALNSYSRFYQVSARTAELCKLMENSWIATKVMFVNEFFELASSIGVDWNELREIWLADPRVSRSHTFVFPENRGFSGKCLPKDLNNLVYYFKSVGVEAKLIDFLLHYNSELRAGYNDSVPLLPKDEEEKENKS